MSAKVRFVSSSCGCSNGPDLLQPFRAIAATGCSNHESEHHSALAGSDVHWVPLQDAATALGISRQALQKKLLPKSTVDFRFRRVRWRGGYRYEVALQSLPPAAQAAYLVSHSDFPAATPPAAGRAPVSTPPGAGAPSSIIEEAPNASFSSLGGRVAASARPAARSGASPPGAAAGPSSVSTLPPVRAAIPAGGDIPRPRRVLSARDAWERYERLPQRTRDVAAERTRVCRAVLTAFTGGVPSRLAIAAAAREAGVPADTVRGWYYEAKRYDERDWLAVLAPRYRGRTARVTCTPEAWDWLQGHYCQRSQPCLSDSYRRAAEIAAVRGWTLPPERTLRRRIETDVDPLVLGLLRHGPEWLRTHLPQAEVTKDHLAAGEAVTGDGLDVGRVRVLWPDGEIITPTLWVYADVASGKILASRADKTENTDGFRLATYDLLGVCYPKILQIDNTRVAANKAMTGQAPHRHRFHNNPDTDPLGLLVLAGIEVRWSNPDTDMASPGQKPIERAFGKGGIHEMIANNPALADRGYSNATAAPLEEFLAVVDQEIARYNARKGRRTEACRGKLSFNDAWDKLVEKRGLRTAPASLRDLFLLMPEVATVDRYTGVVKLKAGAAAGLRPRYWASALCHHTGERVTLFYDPEDFEKAVTVTTMDGRVICRAERLPGVAFANRQDARSWHRERERQVKAVEKAAQATTRMTAIERKAMAAVAEAGAEARPMALAAGEGARPSLTQGRFGRALKVIQGELVDGITGEVLDEECQQIRQRMQDNILAMGEAARREVEEDNERLEGPGLIERLGPVRSDFD